MSASTLASVASRSISTYAACTAATVSVAISGLQTGGADPCASTQTMTLLDAEVKVRVLCGH